MEWSQVQFGKHKGKTLPQVLFCDPDWFFWAMENSVFRNKGTLESEAEDLDYKARHLRIPKNDDGNLVVEYIVHQATGKFSRFNVVPANERHEGHVFRLPVIDMS